MTVTFLGPVPPNSTQYTERKLDESLWLNVNRFAWTTLFGGRQSGKSSALRHLQANINSQGGVCAYVDLSIIPRTANDETFIRTFCGLINLSLDYPNRELVATVEIPTSIVNMRGYFEYFTRAFEAKRPVVVMVDEASAVPDDLRAPFFSSLRALQGLRADATASPNLKELVIIFAGTFDPNELIDTANSPFNVSDTLSTSREDFNDDEVSRLVKSLGAEINESDLIAWTGGHPYLTVRMIMKSEYETNVDHVAEELIMQDMHFSHLGQQLGALDEAAINILRRVKEGVAFDLFRGAHVALDRLATIGLIVANHQGKARIRNKSYEKFVEGYITARLSAGDGL